MSESKEREMKKEIFDETGASERERKSVCVCVRERRSVCECACDREGVYVSVRVCV